jgi:hypothetical protein
MVDLHSFTTMARPGSYAGRYEFKSNAEVRRNVPRCNIEKRVPKDAVIWTNPYRG